MGRDEDSVTFRVMVAATWEERVQLARVIATDGDGKSVEASLGYVEGEFAGIDPARKFFVVGEEAGRIVGFVRIWNSPHIEEWVNDGIVVVPEWRGKGVATRLLARGLVVAGERGARSVIAHVGHRNAASIRLHERLGFERETTTYRNSEGEPRSDVGWQFRVRLNGGDGQG